ncbi:helix-turn-helix domain containing protein [Flavobacterium sp. N1994]|uniref:helix-turn-helix domain containing protein n=1 Tax=Flavobacterium sp. N1994 TaxID=2986827 RepID=UPI0022212F1C|nr:helix-turn-helix domain containing protein [Flavobacterium sp. N1994]
MQETVIHRIKKVCKWLIFSEHADNDRELAELLGYSKSSFSQILNEKVPLSDRFIDKLCGLDNNINKVWVKTGDGDFLKENNVTVSVANETTTTYSIINDEIKIFDNDQEPEVLINSHGNKFLIYPDGVIKIEVLKVPFKAYASYVENYFDEVKLKEDFSTITFRVDHIGRGNYLAFESVGDSMWNEGGYDTPSGADLLGREISKANWKDGFHKTKYGFVIISKTGMFHKDINKIDNNGCLILTSRNPLTKPFSYPLNDITQIFHVIKRSF